MVYLLILFFETYNIYLILFISFFCLLKRLLKGNKYFEGKKHSLENWNKSVFIYKFIYFIVKIFIYFYLFIISCT